MAQKPWAPPEPAEIKRRWQTCVDDMIDLRRNYWLNHAYFMGDQWLRWDDHHARPDILEFADDYDADTRVTVNKIKPRTLSLMARLTRTPLTFEPRPEGVDQESIRKASLQRQILEVESHRAGWEQLRIDNVQNCLLGAVGAVAWEPDWEYQSVPVVQMETGEPVRLPRRPAVKCSVLSAAEFGIEPGTRHAGDARWWIRCTTLTPEQAQDRYGLDEPPKPDALSAVSSPLHRELLSRRSSASATQAHRAVSVYVYYERPTLRSPGCVRHVVGGKVVQESAWPFPHDTLNLAVFCQTPISSTWKGETIVNDARQMQRNLNKVYTSVNRHIGKADNARMILPMGATIGDEDDLTGDVGEVIRVDPSVGNEPHWMNAPQVPRWLREHKEDLTAELDDLFSTHEVSRGQAPGDRNSGTALAILAEKDETPLGPMAANQQRGWQTVAEGVLATMRHLMAAVDNQLGEAGVGPMQVEDVLVTDDGTPQSVTWTAADLPEHPVVHVPLEAVMPRSAVAQQDMMLRLAQTFPALFQQIPPSQLANVLRVPDPSVFAVSADPQAEQAKWENSRMILGVGDDEVMVDDWHDHLKHIAQHNELRASPSYRNAPEDVQAYIDGHIEAHAVLYAQMMAPTVEMPPGPEGGPDGPPQAGSEQGVAA